MGDTGNLTARLEAQTKSAGRAVLVDAATQDMLAERVATHAQGATAIRSMAAEVTMFSVKTSG